MYYFHVNVQGFATPYSSDHQIPRRHAQFKHNYRYSLFEMLDNGISTVLMAQQVDTYFSHSVIHHSEKEKNISRYFDLP